MQALLGQAAGPVGGVVVPFAKRGQALMSMAMQNPEVMAALAGAPDAAPMLADKLFGGQVGPSGITEPPSQEPQISAEDEARLNAMWAAPAPRKKKPQAAQAAPAQAPGQTVLDIFSGQSALQQPGGY